MFPFIYLAFIMQILFWYFCLESETKETTEDILETISSILLWGLGSCYWKGEEGYLLHKHVTIYSLME
jgi:hypothetical protein